MVQQASSFKQSVESALGADNVVVDLQKVSDDDFQNITYFSDTAAARDYDISGGGWAPDYQDPSTYLESISPVNGSVSYYFGIDAGTNNPAIAAVGLDQYANMLKDVYKRQAIRLAVIPILGCMMCWFKKKGKTSPYTISWPFMTWYSISNVLKNPFLMKFLMEAMIQQRQFG